MAENAGKTMASGKYQFFSFVQLIDSSLGAKNAAETVGHTTKKAYDKTVETGGKGENCFSRSC